jgi:hypothetical protein
MGEEIGPHQYSGGSFSIELATAKKYHLFWAFSARRRLPVLSAWSEVFTCPPTYFSGHDTPTNAQAEIGDFPSRLRHDVATRWWG